MKYSSESTGRPLKVIDYEKVKQLRKLGLSWTRIADKMNVSRQTLYRHLEGDSSLTGYTAISEQELDGLIAPYISDHPNDGERMIIGYLRSCQVNVQRSRIRESIHRVDPNGVAERRRMTIKRRVYHVDCSNEVWHIDSNHKLIRWKFVIHGATDGFSRTVTMMNCSTDNQASTVLQHFLTGTSKYGLPCSVRTDGGGENIDVWRHMIQYWGSSSCVIVGSSVHNTRIERLWRDVRKSVLEPLRVTLFALEEEGILDPDNEMDIFCLHQALKNRIDQKLSEFTQSWNNHPLRTEGNHTPLQLFYSHDHLNFSSNDSVDDTAQIPSIRGQVDVPSNQFAPCLSLRTQVQTILQVQSHLDDHGLYRSIALSVGTHIRNMTDGCCSMN